jgi:hypothetical protein
MPITAVVATQAREGRRPSVPEGSHAVVAATRESLEDCLPQLAGAVMAGRPSRWIHRRPPVWPVWKVA